MLKKNPPQWTPRQTEAVKAIKCLAENMHPLKIPASAEKRILQTDASDESSEQHYHSTFKEILAVKRGIEKFQFHLIGHEFQVEMDMSSFPRMLQFKRNMLPHAQLLRWLNWFSQWKFIVKHIKGTENVLAYYLSRPKAYKSEENYQKDASQVHKHTSHLLLMGFLVASHKKERSSSTPTPPIVVFNLPEEIVETIGDLTFEKRAKLCYKTFLTILLKNHRLCIKGLRFPKEALYFFYYLFESFTIGITFNAEKLLSYVVKSQFKDVSPHSKHLLTMLQWLGSFLTPKAVNDDGSVMYHAPYCFIHDWYKVNPSSRRCERKLQTLYADTRSLMVFYRSAQLPPPFGIRARAFVEVYQKSGPSCFLSESIESSASKIDQLYEISYVPDDSRIPVSEMPLVNPYQIFTKPTSSITKRVKQLIGSAPNKQIKEFVQTSKFDSHQLPASQVEHLVSLSLPSDLPRHCLAQGYTHIHFGAIRLALTFHGRKGLPAYSRIALLDTSCLDEAVKIDDDDEDLPKKRKSSQQKLKRRYEKGDPTVTLLGEPSGKFDYYVLYLKAEQNLPVFPITKDPSCSYSQEYEQEFPALTAFEHLDSHTKHDWKIKKPITIGPTGHANTISPAEATLNWQSENAIAQNKVLVKILSQQEAEIKNLKNQLQDLERQHKQKRMTYLIDDPWRLPSTPFVGVSFDPQPLPRSYTHTTSPSLNIWASEQRRLKPSTRKEPTFSQESQSIADVVASTKTPDVLPI
ncbi:hypothetical protein Tco_0555541 [Tanacetum coccineum]